MIDTQWRVAPVGIATIQGGTCSGPHRTTTSSIASTITRITSAILAKVLRRRTRDQLLGMLRLGGAAWCQYQMVGHKVDKGNDKGSYGQVFVGAFPVLQSRSVLLTQQTNECTKAFAWERESKSLD